MNLLIPLAFRVVGGLAAALVGIIYFFRKVAFKKRCPYCGDFHGDRVKRPKLLKATLGFLPIKAYHCQACHHSYYLMSYNL
ncbi:hypothetical protein GO755_05335 [Spirosoma sp. HMF4905]|uniref:Uncharacterized protein n=1 Tax=Spirosoma arboris TaxID=2682092 RepID=A0A7K1S6L1_9BACT|nr:hypothetical protein [Spirosoma arboris]MVM29447.1 hypothetical protein [Spirosoma arboris]